MGNFLIAFDNQADDATLTAGNYNGSLPRNNLKDYRVTKKARTASDSTTDTKVRFALAAPMHVGVVGLMGVNCSVDATSQLRLFSDSGFTTEIYDSEAVEMYPAGTIPYGQIPWGAPNWWTAKPLPAEIARFQRNLVHVLPDAMYAQYGEIQITDTANSDGYIEAGRLFVGQTFQPKSNPQYGDASLRLTSRSSQTRARDGTPYFNTERPDFCLPFALKWLTEDEAMRLLDMQAIVDIHGEVLVMWDPDNVAYAFRRQVFGRLKELDPVEHPLFATYANAFQVEGVLYE